MILQNTCRALPAVTLGCVSAATNALLNDHQSGNRGNGGRVQAVHASGAAVSHGELLRWRSCCPIWWWLPRGTDLQWTG